MTNITEEELSQIVSEQKIASIALVDKDGMPHNTPIWVTNKGTKLFVFSTESSKKARIALLNHNCMLAFQFAALRGYVKVIRRDTEAFNSIKDVMDERYRGEADYDDYKTHWDIALEITPTKIYRS